MAIKKTGLGRGLSSLFDDSSIVNAPVHAERPENLPPSKKVKTTSKKITDTELENTKDEESANSETVQYVKLSDIKPNSAQPRKAFDEESLNDLANSIKENGVIQPIVVRPSKKGYELVAGERRWRAARLAGLKEIPALVRDIDEQTNAVYALIENVQREDLNAIEEAEGLKLIMDKYGFTQEETAKIVGKSRPYVANLLRLLELPERVRELVSTGKLSAGHAKAIAGLSGEAIQKEAAEKAVKGNWSVRQIESYAQVKPKKKVGTAKRSKKKDPETLELEDRLAEALGTKVEISGSPRTGILEISYFSRDELDRLVELFEK